MRLCCHTLILFQKGNSSTSKEHNFIMIYFHVLKCYVLYLLELNYIIAFLRFYTAAALASQVKLFKFITILKPLGFTAIS